MLSVQKLIEFKAFTDQNDIPTRRIFEGNQEFLEINEKNCENYNITVRLSFSDTCLSELLIKELTLLDDSRIPGNFFQKLCQESQGNFYFKETSTISYCKINRQENSVEEIFFQIGTAVREFISLANIERVKYPWYNFTFGKAPQIVANSSEEVKNQQETYEEKKNYPIATVTNMRVNAPQKKVVTINEYNFTDIFHEQQVPKNFKEYTAFISREEGNENTYIIDFKHFCTEIKKDNIEKGTFLHKSVIIQAENWEKCIQYISSYQYKFFEFINQELTIQSHASDRMNINALQNNFPDDYEVIGKSNYFKNFK